MDEIEVFSTGNLKETSGSYISGDILVEWWQPEGVTDRIVIVEK